MNVLRAIAVISGFFILGMNYSLAASISFQSGTASFSETCDSANHSPDSSVDGVSTGSNGWATAQFCTPSGGSSVGETAVWETTADFDATDLEFTLDQNFGSGHLLGRFRLSVTTDDRSTFADGADTLGDVIANWTVLANPSASGPPDLSFLTLADNSILVGLAAGFSSVPATASYTVSYGGSFTGITGLRLETIEDASLPFDGPGLQGFYTPFQFNDNFVLTELTLEATGTPNVIPAPAALPLLLSGIAGLGLIGWRRRKAA